MLVLEFLSFKIYFIDILLNIVEYFEYKNKIIMYYKVNFK